MEFNNLVITGMTIRNFLSIGNATQTLRFDQHGMTLVLGQNSDATNGSTRNGAGKSAVLQALSFALYGKPLTKIKIPNLINNINLKGMHVSVDFLKGGKAYRIERGRNPTVMKFYINGEDVTEEDNDAKGENAETQIDINRIVGMSHNMFKHIVALNTYTEPFLKESDAKQRELIEELMGITQMSGKAEKLKAKIVMSKDRVKTLDAQIGATRAANTRIELSIDAARKSADLWETRQGKLIGELREQLELTRNIDFDTELKIFDEIDAYNTEHQNLNNQIKIVSEQLNSHNRSKMELLTSIERQKKIISGDNSITISRIEKEITRTEIRIKDLEEDVVKYQKNVDHFQDLLDNPSEHDCRTCGQKLEGTDHLEYVIKRFKEELEANTTKLSRSKQDIDELVGHIGELRQDILDQNTQHDDTINVARTALLSLENDLKLIIASISSNETEIVSLQDRLTILNGCPKSIFSNRDEIYTLRYETTTIESEIARLENEDNPHIKQINGFRNAIQTIDMTEINQETDTLRHREFLFKLLTSKDSFIRRTIIEQNLAFLNDRFNFYLAKMGLPHEVTFHSDLNVSITLLGRDFDFAQLSRGESGRVIMATSWAFRDVWESLNNTVNIMWVDELIDSGLCSSGAEDALQILKGFARNGRNIFLISHREELMGRIDRTLYISKSNGFTQISDEYVE